jgi:hypothetical protein
VENAWLLLPPIPFLRPAFPTYLHHNHNNRLFFLQEKDSKKLLALFAAREPRSVARTPVNFVVTTTMYRSEVGLIVGAAAPPLDQVVRRVGTRLAADVADAVVSCDHRCRQLAPRLLAIVTIQTVAAHALRRSPAGWPVYRWLPWHAVRDWFG